MTMYGININNMFVAGNSDDEEGHSDDEENDGDDNNLYLNSQYSNNYVNL